MGNDRRGWTFWRICLMLAVVVSLAGGSGCDPLSSPSATPSPTATHTPQVIQVTATPTPTVPPTATPAPTRTPPLPTDTPSPSPTLPAPTQPLTVTPTVSPTPTVPPCQLEAWVSEPNPIIGSHVTVYGELICRDQPVARAQMYVICHYRVLRSRYPESGFESTDEDGVGRAGFDVIQQAVPGETVVVDVYVRYQGREYRAQTMFKPL